MAKKEIDLGLKRAYDELFMSQEERDDLKREKIQDIPLGELHTFRNHPFHVEENDELREMARSILDHGVLTPAIARPRPEGGYELLSGHRRKAAAQLAGLKTLPVVVREMDDDAATIVMVDSNQQRENLLPSEKAFAYKMKLEAIKHQGKATSRQVVGKLEAAALIGDEIGQSGRQVQRFMRLNNLIPEILDMVDEKKIAFNPAVELSYLKPEEQREFLEAMDYAQTTPSVSQAQRIKKLSQQGQSSLEAMCEVMDEVKKPPDEKLVIKSDVLRKYFPKSYTPQQMEAVIMKLLEQWMKKRNREQER